MPRGESRKAPSQGPYERGRPWLGALAWSLTAFKPQIGIAFVALAFALGGWRRLLEVVVAIGALNLLGGLMTTGNPLLGLEYPRHVMSYLDHDPWHKVASTHIVSCNAVVYGMTGASFELSYTLILAGYAIWGVLVMARVVTSRVPRGTPEYWLAATAAGVLLCARSHGYDLVLLVLSAPLMLTLWSQGRRADVVLLGALMALGVLPQAGFKALASRLGLGPYATLALISYRAYIAAAIGVYMLVRGPIAPRPAAVVSSPGLPPGSRAAAASGDRTSPPGRSLVRWWCRS